MTIVNHSPRLLPPVVCDFGWFYGLTPLRLPEYTYQVGTNFYPPAHTTLATSILLPVTTIPTTFATLTALKASFESNGIIYLDNGINHIPVTYTGLATVAGYPSLTGCSGEPSGYTFNPGTPIYDKRFYVDSAPLNFLVTFDAIDQHNLGLPIVQAPSGTSIVHYRWDFGNGQVGYGPFASTTYAYTVSPPTLKVTLAVTDSRGRQFSCAHRLNLQNLAQMSPVVLHHHGATGDSPWIGPKYPLAATGHLGLAGFLQSVSKHGTARATRLAPGVIGLSGAIKRNRQSKPGSSLGLGGTLTTVKSGP